MVKSGWIVGQVVGGVVATALSIIGIPSAMSDPGAETDTQGFVDSTARCDPPNGLIGFGNTAQSRVAICRTPNGQFEYRGVRVNDSAKLIAPAVYRNGAYIAEDDNNLYTVTMSALTVSRGSDIVSQESMINFYQPGTGGPSKEKTPS